MKKVLYMLGAFDDQDAEWFASAGNSVDIAAGQALIREGVPIEAIFFVTAGNFRVEIGAGGRVVAHLGTGEVVGEISYLDNRAPTASVVAVENSRVLAIPRSVLSDKLERDPRFASRFYRAVATFLADRLRATLRQLGGGPEGTGEDELELDELEALSRAGRRFEHILQRTQEV